jgi:PIN domain nuclease of toxin-antitoxin system
MMKLLLDTHVLIWAASGDRRMSRRAAAALADPKNEIFVSVVTHWEIAVKQRRHVDFVLEEPLASVMDRHALAPLDLAFDAPARLRHMPSVHGDPFDRLLVAQALHHQLTLITNDRMIRRYPVETIW